MHRRLTLDAVSGMLNKVGERFGAVDSLGAYSKFEKGSAKYARAIFKYSGLTWWTESLQSAAANVYARGLGIHIAKRTTWNNLHKNFRSQLKRYGVSEENWNFILKNKPLNEDGMEVLLTVYNKVVESYASAMPSLSSSMSKALSVPSPS